MYTITPSTTSAVPFDGGTVIPVAWQNDYVAAVKALGGTVELREYPHDDHFSLPQSCIADAQSWLAQRLGS